MKHTALISALAILALTVCGETAAEEPSAPPAAKPHMPLIPPAALPPGHPAKGSGLSKPSPEAPDIGKIEQATVVSTIDVQGFTYIEIKQGHQTRWLAANTTNVKKGAVIEFENSSTLENFKSKKLDRTFPSITFVNSVTVVKAK